MPKKSQISYENDNFEYVEVSFAEPRVPISHKISKYGLSGSSIFDTKPILKRNQLLQCIDGYMNNGTIRAMVNKRTDFILGNRPKYLVEANDDIVLTELDSEALQAVMSENEADDLRTKINIINKRVGFHEKLNNLVVQNFVLGRAAGGIERKITEDFPTFGEPMALKVLNGLRLKNPVINEQSWELEGIHYDFGLPDRTDEVIPVNKLLPLWYNDHNLYDNTLYTGMSAVWTILSMAQANSYINDEDIPESCKTLWAKYGFVYVGDKNVDSMKKFKNAAKVGTLFFHNNKDLETKFADLKNDLTELTKVRIDNMKSMCIDFGFPMFLLFEDTSNFATAKEVLQAYKAGVLERDRTLLRGFLEKYWYDPILADHLKLESRDELLKQKIKIKAAFDDLNFETRRDIAETDIMLKDAGVFVPIDIAEDVGVPAKVLERLQKIPADTWMKIQLDQAKASTVQAKAGTDKSPAGKSPRPQVGGGDKGSSR